MCALQGSASAPLLQGVKKAVRVSVIAMGAGPLAPKEPGPAAEPSVLRDEKVLLLTCVLLNWLSQGIPAHLGTMSHLVTLRYALA